MSDEQEKISKHKHLLRLKMREKIKKIEALPQQLFSARACRRIYQLPAVEKAKCVMMFLPIANEIDPKPLVKVLTDEGKRVVVPKTDYQNKTLTLLDLPRTDCEMIYDQYQIPTPAEEVIVDASEVDLVLVPGLAFDFEGGRLGRGGGFYDRFLAKPELKAARCGIGFEAQLLGKVPRAAHDLLMDYVVTDEQEVKTAACRY